MINTKNIKLSIISMIMLTGLSIAVAKEDQKIYNKNDIRNTIEIEPHSIELLEGKEIQEVKIKNKGIKREIVSIGLVNWKQKNAYLKGGKIIPSEDIFITSSAELFSQLPKQLSVDAGSEKVLVLIKNKENNRKQVSSEYKILVGNNFSSIEIPVFDYKNLISNEKAQERVFATNKVQKGLHFIEIKNKNLQTLMIKSYKIGEEEKELNVYVLPKVTSYIEVDKHQEFIELNTNLGNMKINVK